MRTPVFIAFTLLSLPALADKAATFNQHCLESENIIASAQAGKTGMTGVCGHRWQLGQEDVAQIQSVQPSAQEPLMPLILTGLDAHRGQLSDEDISQIESVRPADAIVYGRSRLR